MPQNSGFSYWEQASFLTHDVAVIGSGIVGLNAALHIIQTNPSLNIVVVDRGFLPSGASTKNAGFACFGSVSELLDELETTPENELLRVMELRWKGLQKLRKTLGDQALDYQENGGFEIFTTEDQDLSEKCIGNIPYLNRLAGTVIGKPDIYAVRNEKIAGFGFRNIGSMIENRYEGQIDSGKMMRALLGKVQGEGVLILNSCRVDRIRQEERGAVLETGHGSIRARKVVVATNAFATEFFPELDMVPGRGQVLITEPVPGLLVKGTFHYDKGYYYFRNINDRILLGGGRNLDFKKEETDRFGITEPVQNRLEELLHEVILPGNKPKIEQRWSGIMAFGDTLTPIITEIRENVFCAVRCNGMGIAMGSQVGETVGDMVLKAL